MVLVAGFVLAGGASLLADPTTAEQAKRLVEHWLRREHRPLDVQLGSRIARVLSFTDGSGEVVCYAVHLWPSGFVIVAADDQVEPVIAFAARGRYKHSTDNPLGALVINDLGRRVSVARKVSQGKELQSEGLKVALDRARQKWNVLLREPDSRMAGGIASLPDVRVPPLLETRWDQSNVCGLPCYNYYTPKNYVCGCMATAMAQLMRYFKHPVTGVGTKKFDILVDGVAQTRTLRGGNGAGGPYNWNSMIPAPGCGMSEAERQAIGAICHDAGVAVNTSYAPGGSGGMLPTGQLVSVFGYGNAITAFLSGSIDQTMVNSNLDAALPVLLTLNGGAGGHAVVCDGYGYVSTTPYHHLNLGWGGTDTAWYNLPTVDAYYDFNAVDSCVYNVFTSGSGEIISGRVTDADGNPLADASVTAIGRTGGTYTSTTNSRGIYAITKVPSASQFVLRFTKTGYTIPDVTVTTGTSKMFAAKSGNVWLPGDQNNAPVISVTPESTVDFGEALVGETKDLDAFTVKNVGTGILAGQATVSAPFSIVSASTYRLGPGATQTITIRFGPTKEDVSTATVSFTGAMGAARTVRGTGVKPVLAVEPQTTVDFGEANIGESKELTAFTIRNTGTGTLTGTASVGAPFAVTSGASYSIQAGASQPVKISFSPTSTGTTTKTVTFTGGAGATRSVKGTGTRPVLSVEPPTAVDFGEVEVGQTKDLAAFTVKNTGTGTLAGQATVEAPFVVVSGGTYSLGSGQAQTVTIRFGPTVSGAVSKTVTFTGAGGTARTVSGTGKAAGKPALSVEPLGDVDFGEVEIGKTKDLAAFTVRNVGTGTLSGQVTVAAPFGVVSGETYDLGPGASQSVTIRFAPTSVGSFSQTVMFTGGAGTTRIVTGKGTPAAQPVLEVAPVSAVDFGAVEIGQTRDLDAFTVKNVGTGTLAGQATVAAPFSIVSGGSYSLAANASQIVTIRFSPTAVGAASKQVTFSGGGGATRTVSGTGAVPSRPVLSVEPEGTVSFGDVGVGQSLDLAAFVVRNVGSETLIGTASVAGPFAIVSGGSYSLGSNESQSVTIRFSPTTAVTFSNTVTFTGGGGATRTVTGRGTLTPDTSLTVEPLATVDFGEVVLGESRELNAFVVKNPGTDMLVGEATVAAPFEVVSGGRYQLAAGGSQTVRIRFTPSIAGRTSKIVAFTGGIGAARTVTGCGVTAQVLADKDAVEVPEGGTATFAVKLSRPPAANLTVSVARASGDADITVQSGSTLVFTSANWSVYQTVTLAAAEDPDTDAGRATIRCSAPNWTAKDVIATEAENDLPVLSVEPSTTVSFGEVIVGDTKDLAAFTVKNTGGGTLNGQASVEPPFEIVSGGAYSLGAGETQEVFIRFEPTTAGTVSKVVTFTGGGGALRIVSGTGRILRTIRVEPSRGVPGSTLTITAVNTKFGTRKGRVTIGTVRCKVRTWSSATITCTVPSLPPGQYDVTVKPKSGAKVTAAGAFTLMR